MAVSLTDKRFLTALAVLLYCWVFLLDGSGEGLHPEELEAHRGDLAEFVHLHEEEMREVQDARRQQVLDVCQKYGIQRKSKEVPSEAWDLGLEPEEWSFLKRVNWYYIYWSKPSSLVWCKVPKAGSSTWTYNFLKLAGVDPKQHIHKALRDHYPKQDSNRVMKDTFRFMVVRHPFERILSAYRDKLEDLARDLEARDGFYYTMYGKHIVAEYREHRGNRTQQGREPTWREFVTYLLNTPVTKFDEHWMPIWMLCSPCIVRYDVIAKMESFSEDTQFTLAQAGLEAKLTVEWKHRTGTGGSSDTIAEYFSQLTQSEVAALFRKYQLDFELYGYDPEPYFDIALVDPPEP